LTPFCILRINTHMAHLPHALDLTRRERQIMNVIYQRGQATATEIQQELPDAPSNSGVRTLLKVLVDKGQLEVEREGVRFVYRPRASPRDVSRTALRELVRTFFGGSREDAMLALLSDRGSKVDAETERELRALIRKAKRKE